MPSLLGLPSAWQGQDHWHVLALEDHTLTAAAHFLSLWALWKAEDRSTRPRLLHHTVLCAQPLDAAGLLQHFPCGHALHPLAVCLAPQLYGLLPGVHRITLEGGQLLLTLWLGEHQAMLRQQTAMADSVWLGQQVCTPNEHTVHTLKALARHCRRGTLLAAAQPCTALSPALLQCGMVLHPREDIQAPSSAPLRARFDPPWTPRLRPGAHQPGPVHQPGTALVLGAGLAGSAAARSLALRGWQVTVLVAGTGPADGASGLPAGLFCPHVSPDDSVLSRLSRSGVRQTLERLRLLCAEGVDWAPSGVLEHCTDGGTGLPPSWPHGPGADWSSPASPEQLAQAGLPPDTVACWHTQAGWVRPTQLVQAQLNHPNICVVGDAVVQQLQRCAAGWQALNATGQPIAQADIAVLAAGPATAALLPPGLNWPLQPIRGQITRGPHQADNAAALPPFPVNGNGNLVTQVPASGAWPQSSFWVMGSTFERDVTALPISAADQAAAHAVNHGKLSTLLPASGIPMAPWFDPQDARCQPTWGRVRVASHDRLPIAGAVGPDYPGLWTVTALGSRGLTLSVLCGELLAARLHGEPLPLDAKLAQHLDTERLAKHRAEPKNQAL